MSEKSGSSSYYQPGSQMDQFIAAGDWAAAEALEAELMQEGSAQPELAATEPRDQGETSNDHARTLLSEGGFGLPHDPMRRWHIQ